MPLTAKDIFDAVEEYTRESNWYDVYPGYEYPVSEAPSYPEYFFPNKAAAKRFVNETLAELRFPRTITIYRAIHVPSGDPNDIDPYWGESWSYERDGAVSFGEYVDANFLLTGRVQHANVDWPETLRRYIEYTHFEGGGHGVAERELLVIDPSEIRDVTAERI